MCSVVVHVNLHDAEVYLGISDWEKVPSVTPVISDLYPHQSVRMSPNEEYVSLIYQERL